MLSRSEKQVLIWGGVLSLVGALYLVNRFVELRPWAWAAFLACAGVGALGLYVVDRSDGLVLLAAYVLWAIAGLIAVVPSGFLRGETIACYVLLSVALPFLIAFGRDRARWWALIPAYPLLVISGAIGLAQSGLLSDDVVTAFVLLAAAIPFFVIYVRNRTQWWALVPGGILAAVGVSLGSWLPWHSIRESLTAGDVVIYGAALALLTGAAWMLVRTLVARNSSGEATLSGSDGPPSAGR